MLWQSVGAEVYFTDGRGPTSTRPSSTAWRSCAASSVEGRRGAGAAVTGALPAAEDRPGQQQMAQAVADAIEYRPAPRGAGRHGHRQDHRLPRARPSSPGNRDRRHRHQGAAGPTGRQGPAVPAGAPRRAVRLGGAQGPQQLPVHAARHRAAARPGRSAGAGGARGHHQGRDHTGSPSGRSRPPPATRPSSPGRPATRRGRRSASAATSAPAHPVPEGTGVLRRGGPRPRRGGQRGRRQHAPLRAGRGQPAGRSCPSTTWWSSTRRTSWKTS